MNPTFEEDLKAMHTDQHPFDAVWNFHAASGLPTRDQPIVDEEYSAREIELRKSLVREETDELIEALDNLQTDNTVEAREAVLKELCDVAFVAFGTAVQLGLCGKEGFAEVASSNMSKMFSHDACDGNGCDDCKDTGLVALRREDGKILKAGWYTPPILKGLA